MLLLCYLFSVQIMLLFLINPLGYSNTTEDSTTQMDPSVAASTSFESPSEIASTTSQTTFFTTSPYNALTTSQPQSKLAL